MTFSKSYSSEHTQSGEVDACEASCAKPQKPNSYQALKPLSLWCTLMIVLYFLQGCFQDGSNLGAVFSALSTFSLVLLPVVVAVVAWKYFRALNAYHKALEKSE